MTDRTELPPEPEPDYRGDFPNNPCIKKEDYEILRATALVLEARVKELEIGCVVANERAKLLLSAKNYWMERAEKSESALAADREARENALEEAAKLCDDPHEHLAQPGWESGYTAAERVCAAKIREAIRKKK